MDDQVLPMDNGNAGEILESVGEAPDATNEINESHEMEGGENRNDPLYVQKRLKQQKRSHDREMREMQARIADMQSRMSQQPQEQEGMNPYAEGGDNNGIDETIRRAVGYALQAKEAEGRKAEEAKGAAHVQRSHGEMQKHLDKMNDKYDDFDEVVKGEQAPFTTHMATAAMLLPRSGAGSAGEVLYKLGKNPEELSRIANLHPLDQATEMVKLSHALISGGEQKSSQQSRPLGSIKSNPVTNSGSITEKTPVSDIRARMKIKGGWK
jgi:hypothetical protein